MPAWFVVSADGTARRAGERGLVIGRAPTCDIVLSEPGVSRRHLLLQLGVAGHLEILPLPGATTILNGKPIDKPVHASHGDVLAFPGGETLRVSLDPDRGAAATTATAWLCTVGTRRIGLGRESLTIGGGDDDVVIETWPAATAQLTWHREYPWLEPCADGMYRNGAPLSRGVRVELAAGDRIAWGSVELAIHTESVDAAVTHREAHVTAIMLEMLPNGGMLTIETTQGTYPLLLPERRFGLAMVLLRPPPPYSVGEYIPDEVVFAAVWPRSESADRGDLNQLVHRLRNDLKAAGLVRPALLERYAKGGATRFVLKPDIPITVRS